MARFSDLAVEIIERILDALTGLEDAGSCPASRNPHQEAQAARAQALRCGRLHPLMLVSRMLSETCAPRIWKVLDLHNRTTEDLKALAAQILPHRGPLVHSILDDEFARTIQLDIEFTRGEGTAEGFRLKAVQINERLEAFSSIIVASPSLSHLRVYLPEVWIHWDLTETFADIVNHVHLAKIDFVHRICQVPSLRELELEQLACIWDRRITEVEAAHILDALPRLESLRTGFVPHNRISYAHPYLQDATIRPCGAPDDPRLVNCFVQALGRHDYLRELHLTEGIHSGWPTKSDTRRLHLRFPPIEKLSLLATFDRVSQRPVPPVASLNACELFSASLRELVINLPCRYDSRWGSLRPVELPHLQHLELHYTEWQAEMIYTRFPIGIAYDLVRNDTQQDHAILAFVNCSGLVHLYVQALLPSTALIERLYAHDTKGSPAIWPKLRSFIFGIYTDPPARGQTPPLTQLQPHDFVPLANALHHGRQVSIYLHGEEGWSLPRAKLLRTSAAAQETGRQQASDVREDVDPEEDQQRK